MYFVFVNLFLRNLNYVFLFANSLPTKDDIICKLKKTIFSFNFPSNKLDLFKNRSTIKKKVYNLDAMNNMHCIPLKGNLKSIYLFCA